MLERFGFTGDRLTARIGDLSGGERRRFQLLRLLLAEPNVLLLDEPTNDLDIETLTVLEDFLDGWPGTLVVVSHDRYFLERVTDSIYGLLGDGQISMLPGGVDEYLAPPSRRKEAVRDRAEDRDRQAWPCRDAAMGAHEHDRLVAHDARQFRAFFMIADQHVGRAKLFADVGLARLQPERRRCGTWRAAARQ